MGGNKVLSMLLVGMWLIAMVGRVMALPICGIDSKELDQCRPAVTGESPKPPSKQCCKVVRKAKLPCLCGYKAVLPQIGVQPKYALALPKKCGLAAPPECHLA